MKIPAIIDLFLHIDKYLNSLTSDYGIWVYLILFIIVFCETGIVVTPFLPGDSLLFAAGAIAAIGSLNVVWLFIILLFAAILGDTVNYTVGNMFGQRVLDQEIIPFIKKKHLDKTHEYFNKYGGKTIIIARFVPIVRTFAPFVAGIGSMNYRQFISFNVIGALAWIVIFVFGGYFFGNLTIVKQNFSLIVFVIIIISLLPVAIELIKKKISK